MLKEQLYLIGDKRLWGLPGSLLLWQKCDIETNKNPEGSICFQNKSRIKWVKTKRTREQIPYSDSQAQQELGLFYPASNINNKIKYVEDHETDHLLEKIYQEYPIWFCCM